MTSIPDDPGDRPGPNSLLLGTGIVALEFATAVSRFVASTLLPVITPDLGARDQLALLVASTSLGLFVALPLANRVLTLLGPRRTLGVGCVGYLGGLAIAALAGNAWVFALGQFTSGIAGGLLAIFGISAAIEYLDDSVRARVVAVSASMWILPAVVGPVATVGLEHLIGWRWTLLVPVPVVLCGRFLLVRAIRSRVPAASEYRPLGRTLLVPVGVAGVIFGGGQWAVVGTGLLVALVGIAATMPPGTLRARRGSQSALAAMMLFAAGYFGADSLITILLTDGFRTSLGTTALVLGAAPIAWGLTSLASAHFTRPTGVALFPVLGMALAAIASLTLVLGAVVEPSAGMALAAWAAVGAGVGLAYPRLYVAASTPRGNRLSSSELATAVITAEAFGGLIGQSVGGAVSSVEGGIVAAYVIFGCCFAAAAATAIRALPPR